VRHIRLEDPLPSQDIASLTELLTNAAAPGQVVAVPPGAGVEGIRNSEIVAVEHGAAVLRARLAHQAAGPFEGDLSASAVELAARFPLDFVWSASRLESYGACPMDFWTGVALALEPRDPPEEGYDVRAFGSMVHTVLEKAYQRTNAPSNVEAVLVALPEVAREVLDAAPRNYGFRPTALWQHQRAEIEQLVRKTIVALAEEAQDYAPCFYEQAFGFKGQPVLDAGDVRLHGFIDRVDAAPDGRLRVMDYKTSSTLISARDLAEGHRLQLPLYALAARDALKLGDVDAGFYWHVGSARPSSLKLESFEGGVEAAIVTAVAYARAYVQAICEGKFSPRVPPGDCPSYCPATAWCWRFSGARR
jgi:RecB family exonuclease